MLYNHDIIGSYPDETLRGIAGAHLYVARSLIITEPDDIIQLHPELRLHWETICAHYERVGIRHAKNVIWDLDPKVIRGYSEKDLSLFMYGEHYCGAHRDESRLQAVEMARSKNDFIAFASKLGAPVPNTKCFKHRAEFSFDAIVLPCYVKTDVSASGVGIYRAETKEEVIGFLETVNGPFQVQQEVKTDVFLNVQYDCHEDGAKRMLITEQILNGFVHAGNRYPARSEPWHVTDLVADELARLGVRGVIGIDVALDGDNAYILECNPRYNGATYPTIAAQKLNAKSWLACNVSTTHEALSGIDFTHEDWYDPKRKCGVIIVNWGCLPEHKLGLLAIGSRSNEREMISRLTRDIL